MTVYDTYIFGKGGLFMGKRISKPVTISLQPKVLDKLDSLASSENMNRSQYISNLIQEEIKRQSNFVTKLKSVLHK